MRSPAALSWSAISVLVCSGARRVISSTVSGGVRVVSLMLGGRWIVCCSAAPERQRIPTASVATVGLAGDRDVGDQRAQQPLAVLLGRAVRGPQRGHVARERLELLARGLRRGRGLLGELGLCLGELAELVSPSGSRGCGRRGGSRARRRGTRARHARRHSGRARRAARARGSSARGARRPHQRRRARARSPPARAPRAAGGRRARRRRRP